MSLPRRKVRTVGKRKRIRHKTYEKLETSLRKGDAVMVIAGGNQKKQKIMKGQVGKVLKFLPKTKRIIVEGINMIKRHKRATYPNESSGIIQKEGSIHISNVMFYSESLKRPVRLKFRTLKDGRKVRGYLNPATKSFEQIDV